MKLARSSPTTYFGLRFPIVKYVNYVVKMKYNYRRVDFESSTADRANFRGTDLPLYIQPGNHKTDGGSKTIGEAPDFSSLKRRNYELYLKLELFTLEKLRSWSNRSGSRKLEEQCRTGTVSSNPFLRNLLASQLFHSDEDRASAGEILLNHHLLVACEYGRPKKLTVILFENRLVFLRVSASQTFIQYDLPIEYLLQVTHRNEEPGSGVLAIFWNAEPDGPHEIAGAELHFDDLDQMILWAGYLALAVQPSKQYHRLREMITRNWNDRSCYEGRISATTGDSDIATTVVTLEEGLLPQKH